MFGVLAGLIALSAFFSSSETALMALNRYRMRHLARQNHRGARMASALLKQPDRLLGLILLGNNLVNILATSIATVVAIRLAGDAGVWYATAILTVVVLIFAEVAPKTLAAVHPEGLAYKAVYVLTPLTRAAYPVVWVINQVANLIIRPFGKIGGDSADQLSSDELRTLVMESAGFIPVRHRRMLLNILDLEDASVSDVMVPRSDVVGVDLEGDWTAIVQQLSAATYTRLPVFRESLDNVVGLLHIRTVLPNLADGTLTRERLERVIRKPYFIPETTSLTRQLMQFQERERRIGLVVDEYGDIQGLVTLDDILEEIVGEYTTEPGGRARDVEEIEKGVFRVEGGASVRTLNRKMRWELPTDGPRTLNGLLLEQLEEIPEPGTQIRIGGLIVSIDEVGENSVGRVTVRPEP